MPRYRPETEKLKAQKLIKAYQEANFNQHELARREGVSQPAIFDRLHKPYVQKTLAEYLEKHFPKSYIQKKFKEGLEASKVIGYLNSKVDGVQKVSDEFIEVPDLRCRHRYLVTLLECQGHLKHNGNNKGITVINIVYGHRTQPTHSPIRAESTESEST